MQNQNQIVDYQKQQFLAIAVARGWVSARQVELINASAISVSGCVDRSGSLDIGIPVKVMDPLPVFEAAFNKSLWQVCLERADELLALGRRLSVYWSGGIDSTGVLTSLLRAGAHRSQLLVVMSHASIAEYPLFYERFIEDQLDVRMVRPSVFPDIVEDELIVTGEMGDQIFGSVKVNAYAREGNYKAVLEERWENHIKYSFDDSRTLRDSFQPLVDACPFKIVSIYDFLWWVNFTCKWQHVLFRITNASSNPLALLANVMPFYRSNDFQQLAMNEDFHRTSKTGLEHATYKQGLKRFIEEFTGDADYTAHKIKIGSLPVKFHSQRFLFLLESGERVRYGGPRCDDPGEFERVHGSRFDSYFQHEKQAA